MIAQLAVIVYGALTLILAEDEYMPPGLLNVLIFIVILLTIASAVVSTFG